MPVCLAHGNEKPCRLCMRNNPRDVPRARATARPLPSASGPDSPWWRSPAPTGPNAPSWRSQGPTGPAPAPRQPEARGPASSSWRSQAPSGPAPAPRQPEARGPASSSWRSQAPSGPASDPWRNNRKPGEPAPPSRSHYSPPRRIRPPAGLRKKKRNERAQVMQHTHGTRRPCQIRCGMNEAICILNSQAGVAALFTDGLAGCVQVILRTSVATFTCHIGSSAPAPAEWMMATARDFVAAYGAVQQCVMISASESDLTRDKVAPVLHELFEKILQIKTLPGALVNIKTGNVVRTGVDLATVDGNVAGFLTAPEMIHRRWADSPLLGETLIGDYLELCQACNHYDNF